MTAAETQRAASTASMLQSPNPNEVAVAARKLVDQLARHDLRIGDVVRDALSPRAGRGDPLLEAQHHSCPGDTLGATNWRAWALFASEHQDRLTPWERRFVASIAKYRQLSDAQATSLWGIVNKLDPWSCGQWGAP